MINKIIELLKDKRDHVRPKFADLYKKLRHFHYSEAELSIICANVREVLRLEEEKKIAKKKKTLVR